MTNPNTGALYKKIILDHCKHPRNSGVIDNPDIDISDSNPICGDEIRLTARIDSEAILRDIRFEARGCAISIASASMLTELLKGKLVERAKNSTEEIIAVFKGKKSPEALKQFENIYVLRDVLAFPSRIKCVLMCWQLLRGELKKM